MRHQRPNVSGFIYIHYAAPPYWVASAPLTSSRLTKFGWVPFVVCNAWQRSTMQNLRMVGENSSAIFSPLWTKVHESFRRRTHRRPIVLSNTLAGLSISFVQKIFAIKSWSCRKTKQMYKVFGPQFFGTDDPGFFYDRLLTQFTVHHLARFGWVPFADLHLQSLAMK